QIADAYAICGPGLALIVVDHAGHDLEQRGLTRTVDANDADFGAGQEGQRDVLQDLLAPRISLGEPVHVKDVLRRGHLVWRLLNPNCYGKLAAVLDETATGLI